MSDAKPRGRELLYDDRFISMEKLMGRTSGDFVGAYLLKSYAEVGYISAYDAKCAELAAARNLTALAHGINKDLKAKIKRMKDAVDNEVTCADCVEAIGEGYTMCGDCSCE